MGIVAAGGKVAKSGYEALLGNVVSIESVSASSSSPHDASSSPGWSFFYSNEALPDERLGVAQLSNRLLIPPDALTFAGQPNGDPGAVTFDAMQAARTRHVDVLIIDTAGRLHTKTNLMDELRKVRRVAEKAEGTVNEVLLVIDATTGQNGLSQAREFAAATDVTGVVLTKLDGSAKGGIVFAIETELGLPVKLVGLGETIGDLVPFDAEEFVGALFADS